MAEKIEVPTDGELQRAIALLADAELGRENCIEVLQKEGLSEALATRLTDWIPEVFGFTLAKHLGEVRIVPKFSARTDQGAWKTLPFTVEPIIELVTPISCQMFHEEDNQLHFTITSRSSAYGTIEKILEKQSSLDGCTMASACSGLSADVYRSAMPWWVRLFWK